METVNNRNSEIVGVLTATHKSSNSKAHSQHTYKSNNSKSAKVVNKPKETFVDILASIIMGAVLGILFGCALIATDFAHTDGQIAGESNANTATVIENVETETADVMSA